jgi:hypothetical protein
MRRGRVPPGCRAHRRSHGPKMDVNLSFHLSRRDMEYTIGKALSTMSRARYELCQQPQQRSDDFGAATGEEGHQKTKTGDNMEVNSELIVGRKTMSCSDDRRCSIRDAGVPPVEQDPTIGTMIHKRLCNLGCRWRRINSSILDGLFVRFHGSQHNVSPGILPHSHHGRPPPLDRHPSFLTVARDLTRCRIALHFAQPTRSTTLNDLKRKSKGTKSENQGEMETTKPSRPLVYSAPAPRPRPQQTFV